MFADGKSIQHTENLSYFDNFEFDILMQVVISATLPLQLGFKC